MKASMTLLSGVLLSLTLTLGCSYKPADVSELFHAEPPASIDDMPLDSIIKPAPETALRSPIPNRNGEKHSAVKESHQAKQQPADTHADATTGFNLSALGQEPTASTDTIISTPHFTDIQSLREENFLVILPEPPSGKKYVWNERQQVTLADD